VKAVRIAQYGFVEDVDYVVVHVARSGGVGGTPLKEYYGTISMGKELAMVENNDRARASPVNAP
jgi:phage anti-repressor protein